MKYLTILFLLITQFSLAQSTSVQKIIDKIDFQEDTVKSVFDWMADNIKYDVAMANEMKEKGRSPKNTTSKSYAAYKKAQLEKVIQRKKGVCQDYSLLFHTILTELGYDSYIVQGYTKDAKGRVRRSLGHTWNAVKINGAWKLYDPTWGAGVVKDGKKFIKRYSLQWYDVSPEEMIKTHMPYDPMWQLLDHPLSYQDFDQSKAAANDSEKYNYQALLAAHFQKPEKEQLEDRLSRSQAMGPGIRLLEKWRKTQTKNIDMFGMRGKPDLLRDTSIKDRESAKLFNEYIAAKNKRFKGKKWTMAYSKTTLMKVKEQTLAGIEVYKSIDVNNSKVNRALSQSIGQSERLLKRVDQELKFLDQQMGAK